MIVTCPSCQTRYRFRNGEGQAPPRARCSRCDEVFPLSPSTSAYRIVAAVRHEPQPAGAMATTPAPTMPVPEVPAAEVPETAPPAPAPPEPVVPAPDNLDLDLPATEQPSVFDSSELSIPQAIAAPAAPAPEAVEPAEAIALPKLRPPVEPAPGPARRSVLRSLFNVVFGLLCAGLGGAGGYFSYPGDELQQLIATGGGSLGGLLVAVLLMRWIAGRR